MTGLVRKATLFTACGVLMAAAAMAGVPSPANSTVPGSILIVGNSAGVADTVSGVFAVTVRDLANNPINGSAVAVDFVGAGDLRVCSDQLNLESTVNCAAKTVRRFTDAAGQVRFTILGGSNGAAATSLRGTVKVFADGVLLTNTTTSSGFICGSPDLDGASGLGANDISRLLTDIGTGQPFQRADLDGSGGLGANDISVLLTLIGRAGSTSSCASYCP